MAIMGSHGTEITKDEMGVMHTVWNWPFVNKMQILSKIYKRDAVSFLNALWNFLWTESDLDLVFGLAVLSWVLTLGTKLCYLWLQFVKKFMPLIHGSIPLQLRLGALPSLAMLHGTESFRLLRLTFYLYLFTSPASTCTFYFSGAATDLGRGRLWLL